MSLVEYEFLNNIAYIELNRPDRLNAVVPQLVEELCQALERAERDSAGVVVLRGHGRAFCAGHDLREPTTDDDVELRRQLHRIQDVTRIIKRLPCPVIASVHGYALGAGCEFALCSDLVIAADDACFGFPEVDVALAVTGGITHVLPHAIGFVKAKELLLLGEQFTAERAYEWGLVNRVVPAAELRQVTDDWALALAKKPVLAMSVAKQALDTSPGGSLESALNMETTFAHLAMRSGEITAKAAAFSPDSRLEDSAKGS